MFGKYAIYLFCLFVAIESNVVPDASDKFYFVVNNNEDCKNDAILQCRDRVKVIDSLFKKSFANRVKHHDKSEKYKELFPCLYEDDNNNLNLIENEEIQIDDTKPDIGETLDSSKLLKKLANEWRVFNQLRSEIHSQNLTEQDGSLDLNKIKSYILNESIGRQFGGDENSLSLRAGSGSDDYEPKFYISGVKLHLVTYEADKNTKDKCIGVVINKFYILTAKHCGNQGLFVDTGHNRHRLLSVIAMENTVEDGEDFISFDLQLLKIKKPLILSAVLQPVRLPKQSDFVTGDEMHVIMFTMKHNAPIIFSSTIMDERTCADEMENPHLKDPVFCVSLTTTIEELEDCVENSNVFLIHDGYLYGVSSFDVECGGTRTMIMAFHTVPRVTSWIKKIVERDNENLSS